MDIYKQMESAQPNKGNRMAEILSHAEAYNKQATPMPYIEEDPSEYTTKQNEDFGEQILEGKGSDTCCCSVTDLTALGEPVYTCCESTPGECMFRIGSEPSLTCLYCLERFEGDQVRKACIREEAQEYAYRKMYEEQAEAVGQ